MTRQCSDCGRTLCKDTKGEKCIGCLRPTPPDKFCMDCGTKVGRYNKSGRCKSCTCRYNVADPEINARRIAACNAAFKRPEVKARRGRAISAYLRAHPEAIERRREFGRQNAHKTVLGPKCRARKNSPEGIARMKETLRKLRLAGIPPKWLDDYQDLMRRHKMKRAEALKILADRDKATLAAMSPFERQMHALKNGARLVEKIVAPGREYDFTLGGVTDWAA